MSGLPALRIDTADPLPVYEQLRLQLAALIRAGVLGPGQRLPPLRQLASDLGIAVGTAARAYRQLEREGLVTSRRGGGTRVRPGAALSERDRRRQLRAAAQTYVQQARLLGATDAALRGAIDALLAAEG